MLRPRSARPPARIASRTGKRAMLALRLRSPSSGCDETRENALSRLRFTLDPVPPFRLDLTIWVLRRRPDNAVDRWDGETYRRVLMAGGEAVSVAVRQVLPPDRPRLEVEVSGATAGPDVRADVSAALARILGTHVDLADFYAAVARDPRLGPLARRFCGVKPPRLPDVFECLVNAIACQQVTLTLGIRLLNRVADRYGAPGPTDAARAFPAPDRLAAGTADDLRGLGFSRNKARAILDLAAAVAGGDLDLEALAALDDATAVARLCALRGIGRWSAEYALLRGLGRLHVFPGDDVGARNNLRRWLGFAAPLDYAGVRHALTPWARYGGLVYFYLLLDNLAKAGYVTAAG
jgi:DNA-3-methyladenine glycosylase II